MRKDIEKFKKFLKPQTKRNAKIFALRMEGKTFQEIGDKYYFSRQRARAIFSQELEKRQKDKVLTK